MVPPRGDVQRVPLRDNVTLIRYIAQVGRPKEHNEQTAAALLDAAESIVATEGLEALSVRRVAERAATTTRAVYSVFGSREGMLVALGTRAFEVLGAWVAEAPSTNDPLADLVEAGAGQFRRWTLEHPALFRVAFPRTEIAPALSERFGPVRLRTLSGLVDLVGRALDRRGTLADPEIRDATVIFHAMCEGLALLELRGVLAPHRAEQVWREGLTALVTGMRMRQRVAADQERRS
jgi:AcrR family transcriptional regulator